MEIKIRLDLGSGASPREGFQGVDVAPNLPGVLQFDLRQFPWPWPDGSVDEIWSSHFVEHLTGEERIRFMVECYRVLKPNGKLTIVAPHWQSYRAYMDPTHKFPPLTERSMLYFDADWRRDRDIEKTYAACACHFKGTHAVTETGVAGGMDIKFELWKQNV